MQVEGGLGKNRAGAPSRCRRWGNYFHIRPGKAARAERFATGAVAGLYAFVHCEEAMKPVLICEDEPLAALDLEQMVYDAGHRPVGPARTYSEALELAEVMKPAIAILDLHLADGVTGAKVARALSKQGVRIVVLSGVTDVLPALAGIPHVFIPKPVDPQMVIDVLGIEAERARLDALPVPASALTPAAVL